MKKHKANAEIREIKIVMSQMDLIHNNYRTITEFYIPKDKISFNLVDGDLHVFHTEDYRYADCKTVVLERDVYLSPSFVKMLKEYLDKKDQIAYKVRKQYHECGITKINQ